jgi:hypothetical protein
VSASVARLAIAARVVAMICLAGAPVFAAPLAAAGSRAELDALQAAIDAAVTRVSRPSGLMFGRTSRAYHLPGYGAFVVLAPRALPREPRPRGAESRAFDDMLRHLEETIAGVRDPEERRRLQETVAAMRAGLPPGPPRMMMRARPHLAGPPADPAAMQESAEAFRREAELAMERAERDVLVRLRRSGVPAPPPPPVPAVLPMPPAAPPVVLPTPPAPPRVARSAAPVLAPAPPLPPPGWTFEFDAGPGDAMAPDRLVSDVRRAIVAGLGAYRGALDTLGPDDVVVVAVDFVPRMADGARTRTVVARARKRDLAEHRAGRLSPEALHARVAFDEY